VLHDEEVVPSDKEDVINGEEAVLPDDGVGVPDEEAVT
jgi:hypothetical protein